MILTSKDTTIAYRCPNCGKNVVGMVGLFSLSGDMIKLKCACGKSELIITRTSDGKLRLSVPCLLCPNPHNYVIGTNVFFDKGVFTLDCTYSDISICFIGTQEEVSKALRESDEELGRLMDECGLDDYDELHKLNHSDHEDDPDIDDYMVSGDLAVDDIVRFMLAELADEHLIKCRCKPDETPEYDFTVKGSNARVFCKTCGAYKDFPMGSALCADAFLNIDDIELK